LCKLKRDGDEIFGFLTLLKLCFQEKLLRLIILVPVLRTDTGGQGENPKVSEITMVKELGKITP
jgi:hypothetical protein